MKKLFKTFAVLALTGTMAFAANVKPNSFKVGMYNVQNTNTLKIFLEKENDHALVMEIKDLKGNTLQRELVGKNKTNAGVSLDLSNLESGEYTLQISDKHSTYTKNIEVQKKEIKEELKIVI
jgi:hypothetical protein